MYQITFQQTYKVDLNFVEICYSVNQLYWSENYWKMCLCYVPVADFDV